MQQFAFDIIGTHLNICIDTDTDCSILFTQIESRLRDFEQKYSRFISGNWLDVLNQKRTGTLDTDGQKMLAYMLDVSRQTDGYFDPTVGKRLTELGYGVRGTMNNEQGTMMGKGYGDYRDIELDGDRVTLYGDILLEFGGVGKGYLIDVIQGMLDAYMNKSYPSLQKIMEGEWCRFSPGEGGVRGGYTEYDPSLLRYARENRKGSNDPEKNLWFLLRGEKLGYKFHRQKPIGKYIVDFYCAELQLIIELDGESHIDQLQYDAKRTQEINALGIHILRYTNKEIMETLEGVQEDIMKWINTIKEYKESLLCNPSQPPLLRGGAPENRYLINFGGDMYGRGGWTVGLESPFASDEVIGTILLDDHFLACSAGTRRKWGTHHHLIDPHTGESANSVIASYIEGASGMIVDSYATALCVIPWELAIETLEKTPEISGVIVSREGNIYQKKGSRAEVFI